MNKPDTTVDVSNQEEAGSPEKIDTRKPRSRKWRYIFLIAGVLLLLTFWNASHNTRKREELEARIEEMGGQVGYGSWYTGFRPLDGILQRINDSQLINGAFSTIPFVHLGNSSISDLSPLADFTNIHSLNLDNNQIRDLSPLAGLTNSKILHLENNQISDLVPLSGLKRLDLLYLRYNQISDLTPLSGLLSLKSLDLSDNPDLKIAEIEKLQKALPNCKIEHNTNK